MKSAWLRMLSLLICGCLLLSLTVGSVSAEMSGITGVVPTDEYTFFDFEDFSELCQDAAVFEETMTCVYTGYVDFVIEESITIPQTVTLKTDGAGIRIPAGVTVTLEGEIEGSGIQLEGSLQNFGSLTLESDDRTGLTVAQTGSYIDAEGSRSGAIYIAAEGEAVPENCISGLDMNGFVAEKVQDGENSFWKLTVKQNSGSGEEPDPFPGGEPDPGDDPDPGDGEDIVASGSLDGGLFTWTLDGEGTLTFSGRYLYTNISGPESHAWYPYRDQVKKVIFADTFDFIPEYTCYGMLNLEEVQLGTGVTYIGKYAFHGCEFLTSVAIPAKVTEIREYAFSGCDSLEELIFAENCALETIGTAAFWENSMEELTIPASVKTIGEEAFAYSMELKTLVLQEGLEKLDSNAFAYCEKLTGHLYLPATLTTVKVAFLKSMGFETVEAHCATVEQISDGSTTVKKIVLGENVTAIANGCFEGFTALETVEIRGVPESIGSGAFSNCKNLTTINLPEGLKTIGDLSFWHTEKLEHVDLPEGLESIGDNAFQCSGITAVELPDSVTELGSWAFDGCSNLVSAEIGTGLESLQNQFNDCPKLETVDIGNVKTVFDSFQNCASLTDVVWSDSLEYIQQDSFRNCDAIERLVFPMYIKDLGQLSFADCDNLKNIEFCGDAPQWINASAFENVKATVCYPADNATWTEEVQQKFGGTLTWMPVCGSHEYEEVITEPTCAQNGAVTFDCKYCEYSYVKDILYATGKHAYTDDEDAECNVCGSVRNLEIPTTPMYRLYNPNSGEHFYTGSVEERDMLIAAGWQYEGVAWNAPTKTGAPVYRLYNPNSGDHHYTMSEVERDMLVGYGWRYEGVAFTFPENAGLPVYRLYEPEHGEHLYTMDESEKDRLIADGWNYEGVAFNSATEYEVAQYRLHNPNEKRGAYHFTGSEEEKQNLLNAGWEDQGIGFYSAWG